jgi:multiple sugar transport system substrate-binding protein
MTTTRRILLAAGAAAGLGLAAASPPAAAGEVVWWCPNWGQARCEELVRRFEAASPGTKVRVEVTVSDGLQNRILVALRSGTTPDLIDVQAGWNIPFAATGGLLPLDELVAKEGIDLGDFLPAALGTARHDGKLYGLPFRMEAHALIYSKGAYREAGLDPAKPPQTWPELVEVSKKLTRKTADGRQQHGFGITGGGEVGNTLFRSLPFIWMNGGSIISDDLKTATVNQPAAVEAVKFYTDMLTQHGVAPPSTLQNDGLALRRLFIAGAIAQYQSGQFDVGTIAKENPAIEIGVAPIPHPPGKQTAAILGGWNFVIPKAAKNPAEAGKLLAFLAKPENLGFYTDTFPTRTSAMALPRFQEPILQPFKAMLPHARPVPPSTAWVQIVQVYFNHIQRILLKEVDAQKAMDDAAKEIQALLDKA